MGVMDERSSRIFVGLCLLVLLWIGTYWLYEPGRPASGADVSFDPGEPAIEFAGEGRPGPGPALDPPGPALDPGPDPAPDPEPGPDLGDGLAVRPPAFREYVIQDGDTFKSIARDELGDVGLWMAIARSNPLRDPNRIEPGDVIRLPLDPSNIQGVLVSREDGQPIDPGALEPQPDPWVEYTVRPGDSLSRISLAYYGSSRHAEAIFDANRDQLRSPDTLRVGQVLLLPPLNTDE